MSDTGPTYGRPTPEERLFRVARKAGGPGFLDGAVRNAAPIQQPVQGVRVHRVPAAATAEEVVHFSQTGAVALSPAAVGNHIYETTRTLTKVRVTLAASGTSNTVVTVYRNGSSIGTVTLGSGVTTNTATFTNVFVGGTDTLSAKVTTVGTGTPSDLTVIARAA